MEMKHMYVQVLYNHNSNIWGRASQFPKHLYYLQSSQVPREVKGKMLSVYFEGEEPGP